MQTRRRFTKTEPLKDRLAAFSKELHERADQIACGHEREELLKRARMADTAAHIDEWVNSPGLRPPK